MGMGIGRSIRGGRHPQPQPAPCGIIASMAVTLDDLRRHAVARSLFAPTTLPAAIKRLGFVQADPIRAPARAQDLTLRHRVKGYEAGELERRYPKLAIEEDFFVNYGFLPRPLQALMHPRTARAVWPEARWKQAREVLAFIRDRGAVHPREVDAHFQHGKTRNWFGGSSNASTQLLDGMHYRGLLRVARREGGTRVYAACEPQTPVDDGAERCARADLLVDMMVAKYAPLPGVTLGKLLSHLTLAAPQWRSDRVRALKAAKARLAQARIEGVDWYWPAGERPQRAPEPATQAVRLLTPFDPLVWDRPRFELFWGWAYRFEAYTPAPKRKLGYYALPLLVGDTVPGWANVSMTDDRLVCDAGLISGRQPTRALKDGLQQELRAMATFLGQPQARLEQRWR
jgi:uncharacterized protein